MSQAVQPPGREESAGFPLTILPAMFHICEAFVLPARRDDSRSAAGVWRAGLATEFRGRGT